MKTLAALLLILSFATDARAQTSVDIRACYVDAVRLCGVKKDGKPPATMADVAVTVGIGAILIVSGCLASHRHELSARCRAAFANHGQ